jgi:exodeoxyribonuclease VII large subunit
MSQLQFNLMPDRRAFTVTELTARIRDLFARNFTDIWVTGEISNCHEAQSGHIYCTLKDERAQVRCVCFKNQLRTMKFRPEDGLHVTVRGSISVYESRGEYQIYVENIEPVGLGPCNSPSSNSRSVSKPKVSLPSAAKSRCRFSPAASA